MQFFSHSTVKERHFMTQKFTLRHRLRYRFDNALSKGIWAVLAWLGLLAVLFIVLISIIITAIGIGPNDEPTNFFEAIWLTISRSLDAGTFTGDQGNQFRLTSLFVTLVGIFLAATIIGLISAGIDSQIESLRRGKSLVAETGHSLIIGRSEELIAIISELIEANLSERGKAIAILTPDDPIEVNDDIRSVITDFKTSRVVVRSGKATRINDLAQLNPASARSIIVLRGEGESDAHVVKIVLAIAQALPSGSQTPIVAQIEDTDTALALREAIELNVLTVTPREVIARISAQVSRASGLGVIYQELLDFEGDEIYFTPVTENYLGKTFGDLLLASSTATIIGMKTASGEILLNAEAARVLVPGDSAIGIAEDDSTFALDLPVIVRNSDTARTLQPTEKKLERTLIVGWSDLTPLIAEEIDTHVAP
ncbi:MAG: potassium transporter TrkA, partial [Actinobacteria bacterium]|nr:potassium transporter TrkA [Actinomycetota bacterium]